MKKEFDLIKFANALKKYRIKERWSLRKAAIQLGTTASTLCRIEQGRQAEIGTVVSICEWINVPITKFIKTKK